MLCVWQSCVWKRVCVTKLCVRVTKLCVWKIVCGKVVCDKARAEEEEEEEAEAEAEEEEEDADGIQNQKQEPHTKMWGIKKTQHMVWNKTCLGDYEQKLNFLLMPFWFRSVHITEGVAIFALLLHI